MFLAWGISFLVAGLALLLFFVLSLKRKKANFSKDNVLYFALSFVLLYLMYCVATQFLNMQNPSENITIDWFYFLNLINTTLEGFTFSFDLALIRPICDFYVVYFIAFILVMILTSATTILTVVGIFKNRIVNSIKLRLRFNKGADVVVGISEQSLTYFKQNKNVVLWDDEIDSAEFKELIKEGFVVCKEKFSPQKLYTRLKKNENHLILFRESNYNYSDIITIFEEAIKFKKAKLIKALAKKKKVKDQPLFLHIESTVSEMETLKSQFISKVNSRTNYFISCFNRHELMARQFVEKHPISKYIPREFFNKNNLCLKNGKKINVVFVGFGNVNEELFKLMSIQFQFANMKENKFISAPVNYYIYDNDDKKLFNKSFATLDTDVDKLYKNASLPKIEKICNLNRKIANVNSLKTFEEIENLLTENSFTYVIVSLAGDLENVAYAESFQNRLSVTDNYKIFVRVAGDSLYNFKKKNDKSLTFFGKEDEILVHDNIVNKRLVILSQIANNKYNEVSAVTKKSLLAWERLPLVKQYSNMYQVLNMFFKANILGFDIISKEEFEKSSRYQFVTKDEYESICKPIVFADAKYEDYLNTKTRNMFAFIEKQRWNAFMFLWGYRPMNFEEFAPTKTQAKKDHQLHGIYKKHACLTNYYEGLDLFVKTVYLMKKYGADYKKHKVTEKDMKTPEFLQCADVYYYDFTQINFLYENLQKMGFVLIKREQNYEVYP